MRLIDHAIDQLDQQTLDVARQLGGNTLALNPCILHSVVQLAQVLSVTVDIEVGVLAVQQLMHHKARIPFDQCLIDHSVIGNIGKVYLAVPVDACGGDAAIPN